jgi:hypothetical protein
MTNKKLNNVKQSIGFFSMTISWTLMNILNSIYITMEDGKANDSGVIIFWSGLFISISWVVFIIWPLRRLNNNRKLFKPLYFTIISILYVVLTYSIIVGGIFKSLELVLMFLPQASFVGLFFGLFYSLLIKSKKLIELLNTIPILNKTLFFTPIFVLVFFFWFLPLIAPNLVYRFMPDSVRQEIIIKTIPRFNIGDDIKPLKKALPGYLDHIKNGSGNMSASMDDFAFVIQVHCGKIIRIEYGKTQFDIDGTIYGKLHEKPCL